ncbi:type II toxin-antitoxin system RelE/ParE family toxin [Myceligenerans crystallogenes]|uniref:Type II toxin-antitoxin system RelE/ParE family toxin n=1 Tax=Myceligenerans crystallogenes TaxID=316335 RepID=A0ABN2NH76_9MICO
MAGKEWDIFVVDEVKDWIYGLKPEDRDRVTSAIDVLADHGPAPGRPLVDVIQHSVLANLKELRPGSMRILFVFDPWRSVILLVAGDKAGLWRKWYDTAVPLAEKRYQQYMKERAEEEGAS